MGWGCWETPRPEGAAGSRIVGRTFTGSSGKGRRRKASSQLLIAVPSALQGSVDFGPEVTSSDRSLKLLLNAEDKVRVGALTGHFPRGSAPRRLWAPALGGEAEATAERGPASSERTPEHTAGI